MQIILAALTLATAELAVQQIQEPSKEIQAVQREVSHDSIDQIRKDYVAGKYKALFEELDASYQEVRENNGLQNLAEMRLGPIPNDAKWEGIMKETLQKRNQELLKLVKNDSSFLSEQVRRATLPLASEVDASFHQLAKLQTLAPGKGSDVDENQIIDIDFEYEYKALHLDLPLLMGQKGEKIWEKQIALKMEKMDRMLEASRSFQNEPLKKAIETLHAHFDALLTQSANMTDLMKIAKNPTNLMEDKLASILMKYQEKFADLSKEFLDKQVMNHEKN